MEDIKNRLSEQEIRTLRQDGKIEKLEVLVNHLTNSLDKLSENIGTSNKKLEDVTMLIATQNSLIEKISSIDKDIRDAFQRRDTEHKDEQKRIYCRIEAIEKQLKNYPVIIEKVNSTDNVIKWINRIIISAVIIALLSLVVIKGDIK